MSINPGSKVQVQWSDGNRYPAQVAQVAPGQILVDFGNGNQQWIAEQWISEDAPAPVEQAQVGALEVAGGALQVDPDPIRLDDPEARLVGLPVQVPGDEHRSQDQDQEQERPYDEGDTTLTRRQGRLLDSV